MINQEHILIVDDHKLFIEGLKLILKNELNISLVDTACNGKEAIDICLKKKFDWIIMDVNLPVIDGINSCLEIKRMNAKAKIIFVSMISDLATVNRALKAGANAYILKGNDSEDVIKAIRGVKLNKLYLSEQLMAFFSFNNNMDAPLSNSNYISFTEKLISERESEVLKLICEGQTNEKIANVLSISVRTVDTHRTNMLTKLKLPNTAALVRFAVENKLI
ncbi:MAG TPA: response regulator transcription factor [Bacteroidia bacterium]|nr:response regulator transcription factor [Bacteroidia bacterium]HNU33196.1 response regulator transcription factor [Bacteroidia bacterium]